MEIRCPQCDAAIKTGIEHKIVKCPYCNTNLYFKKGNVLTKESIKPFIASSVAESLLYHETGKKLTVLFEFFPFYRIQKNNKTLFLPGKKTDLIGLNRYTPQGDRTTLENKVSPPDFSIEQILEKIGEKEKTKSIGLLYVPFFKAEDNDTLYYVDAVKGKTLSNKLPEKKIQGKNHHPFALLSFGIITSTVLLISTLPFKIISAVILTFLMWHYDREKHDG